MIRVREWRFLMAYEVFPEDRESESSFKGAIRSAVGESSDLECSVGEINQSYSPNGNLHFGNVWMTKRVDTGSHEIIYAYRPPVIFKPDEAHNILAEYSGQTPRAADTVPMASVAEFYIHELKEGKITARTKYKEYDVDQIIKARVTLFGACDGFGLTDLSRPITDDEKVNLPLVIEAPEENTFAIDALIKVTTKDQEVIMATQKAYFSGREEQDRKLKEIADYHRRPIDNDGFYAYKTVGKV
jgi:hypothetical protein